MKKDQNSEPDGSTSKAQVTNAKDSNEELPLKSSSRRKFLSKAGGVTAASIVGGISGLPALVEEAKADSSASGDGVLTGKARAEKAFDIRVRAALFQKALPIPEHPNNGDEDRYPNRIGNYSKGLLHNQYGEVDQSSYDALLAALRSNNPLDFERIPMGGSAKLKNPQAGLAFGLEGPDSHHLFMPPAPAFSSAELAAEIAENYWMALCRDVPFWEYNSHPLTNAAAADLSKFSDFRVTKLRNEVRRGSAGNQLAGNNGENFESGVAENRIHGNADNQRNAANSFNQIGPSPVRSAVNGHVSTSTLFRGRTPGDLIGPYISQFMWMDISYGTLSISQRMRTTIPGDDYLTNYNEWLTAQNSRGDQAIPNRYDVTPRYIRNGRDLGEWVHLDILFQAYFNALLVLLGMNAPFDENNPYNSYRTQDSFGTFGPPHIQSLVCAVGRLALHAVWFQKWYVHRRIRPEEFAGRVHNNLTTSINYPINLEIFKSAALDELYRRNGTYLLPMGFPEGCPSHPAYGAGHGTVAGACVTILKAWFDESWVIQKPVIPSEDGLSLRPYTGENLTVGGELNKLASNIAIGRNHAGVHWRSDATESLKLGEAVAIGVLLDHKQCYNENFEGFTLTKFDGTRITI